LSKRRIYTIEAEHSSIQSNCIEVFGKNSLSLVTQLMGCLEMEVFTSIRNVLVKLRNFDLILLPVFGALLLSSRSALQQFQLALLRLEKLWTFNRGIIRSGQKPGQTHLNLAGK
jgi:hypothetical protein